jgi:hypothetical protein
MVDWIRELDKCSQNSSIIWKAILNDFCLIGRWLLWNIGDGSQVLIGKYPWVGCQNNHLLPMKFIKRVNSVTHQITTLLSVVLMYHILLSVTIMYLILLSVNFL